MKLAVRQPRGGTVAEFHVLNRKQLQRVVFAETVQARLPLHVTTLEADYQVALSINLNLSW